MIYVQPDISFIKALKKDYGSMLSTCMQCGACTATCELSKDHENFPRKQIILAAWGMKDNLMGDPYPWLCHQCGDCSVTCPRDVRPGDILTGLRQAQYIHYSKPRFLAVWMQDPRFLPLLIVFPVVIIAFILSLAGTLSIPEGPIDYSEFFPHAWLNGSFTFLFILSALGLISGIRQYWKNMKSTSNESREKITLRAIGSVLNTILTHRKFNSCIENKNRSWAHLFVFYGFILLLFVTFFAILSTIFFSYPLTFLNPIEIAGNIGALFLLIGTSSLILNRMVKKMQQKNSYSDWLFLISFWLLTVSGILVETARFLNWSLAYQLYFFHLVMVWMIILYLPYNKFAHFLYRFVALVELQSRRK